MRYGIILFLFILFPNNLYFICFAIHFKLNDRHFVLPSSHLGKFAEVALTATALPVLLDISPSDSLDFGECPVGESVDTLCTIRNESFLLPAIFQFRRIAHFSARPLNGKISPGQTQDVVFSFVPKQVGQYKFQQQFVYDSVLFNCTKCRI